MQFQFPKIFGEKTGTIFGNNSEPMIQKRIADLNLAYSNFIEVKCTVTKDPFYNTKIASLVKKLLRKKMKTVTPLYVSNDVTC